MKAQISNPSGKQCALLGVRVNTGMKKVAAAAIALYPLLSLNAQASPALCASKAIPEWSIKGAVGAMLPTRGNDTQLGSFGTTTTGPFIPTKINQVDNFYGSTTGYGEFIYKPSQSQFSAGLGYGISSTRVRRTIASELTVAPPSNDPTNGTITGTDYFDPQLFNHFNINATGYYYPIKNQSSVRPYLLAGLTTRYTRPTDSSYSTNFEYGGHQYGTYTVVENGTSWDFIPVIGLGGEVKVAKNLYAGSEMRYELSGTGTAQNISVVGLLRYAFSGGEDRQKPEQQCSDISVNKEDAEKLQNILSRYSTEDIQKAIDAMKQDEQ